MCGRYRSSHDHVQFSLDQFEFVDIVPLNDFLDSMQRL